MEGRANDTTTGKPQGREKNDARADAMHAWEKKIRDMQSKAASTDWSKTDFRNLDPKDIGVHLGPPMTREEFEAYRKRSGKPVRIIGGSDRVLD